MTSHAKTPRYGIYAKLGVIASAVGVVVVAAVVWIAFHGSSHSEGPRQVATNLAAPASAVTLTPTATDTATATAPPVILSAQPTAPPAPSSSSPPKEITYTVKPGDNLFVIAQWFHQNGYQPIYDWNRTIIGQDPGLIRPGQVFVVAVEP
jgi:nucleoid-associated protein YgaU